MKHYHILTSLLCLCLSLTALAGGRKVLFIGDSITDGAWGRSTGGSTPSEQRNHTDMNHIYGHGYMMISAARIQALYPEEGWQFWNRGISGNTLDNLAERWNKDALALHPDIVSILVGTNDVDVLLRGGQRAIDIKRWGARYRELLDALRSQNADVKLLLCTPFVAESGKLAGSDDYRYRESMIRSIVEEVEAIAGEYGAVIVPFNSLVRETIAAHPCVPSSYWIWDGIHPSPAMHYLMAEKWTECFSRLVK